jgi:cytochrome c2
MGREVTDLEVERAAKAMERFTMSGYGWSDRQFEAYWNSPEFAVHVTGWSNGYRGSRKGYLMKQVRTALEAV